MTRKLLLASIFCLSFNSSFAQCTATISGPAVYCALTSNPLQATQGGVAYQWYNYGTAIPGATSDTYVPNGANQLTVWIDFGSCQTTSAAFNVDYDPPFSFPILGNNGPMCDGDTLEIVSGPLGGTAPYTWNWTGPGITNCVICDSIIVPNVGQTNAGSYVISGVDSKGCPATNNYQASVTNLTGNINNNGPLCEGDVLNVGLIVGGGTLPYSYQWTGPNTFTSVATSFSIPNVMLVNAGNYIVNFTDANGCTGTVTTNVVVDQIPNVSFTSNSPVCTGDTLMLIASSTTMGVTYTITGPNSFSSTQNSAIIPNTNISYAGVYTATVTNGSCANAANVTVVVNPTPTITATQIDPTTLTSSDGAVVISGVTNGIPYLVNYSKNGNPQPAMTQTASNGNIVIGNLTVGTYDNITVSYNGCPSNIVGPYILTAMTTTSDSVWPGDVNYDLIADNNDALDLALAYGQTGPVRTGASNTWVAQYSADWNVLQVCNQEMKHADCNGDGTVDANDTTAISLNYGQVHLKGEHVPQAKSASSPDLYFDLTGINFTAGTTVSVPIKLGTSSFPMNNVLGIAANVHVSNIVLNNAPTIDASTSWIGTGSNLLNFTKGVGTNQMDWTLARTDHNNVSGDGTIGVLTMDIPAGSQGQDVVLYMDDVKIIDNNGTVITNYNVVDDTATVLNISSANVNNQYANIAPNPSTNEASLNILLEQSTVLNIVVTDVAGRMVWNSKAKAYAGANAIALPAAQLAQGSYFVKINDDNIVNLSLKWQLR